MKATETETLWAVIGLLDEIDLMAHSVVVYGKGCFLKFCNLVTGKVDILTTNSHKGNGDGVKCYRGHSSLYIFAYSENGQEPNIYIKSYPDFQLIAKFPEIFQKHPSGIIESSLRHPYFPWDIPGMLLATAMSAFRISYEHPSRMSYKHLSGTFVRTCEKSGYKCLAFSDSSLLFSLGEMPYYKVTAWNWRTSEKFAESSNEVLYENQIIRCNYGRPMYLAQLGVGSNKLFIWDVFTVCKTTIFAKHEVKIGNLKPGPFGNVVWSLESVAAAYVIDDRGNIYTFDRDFHLELVVDMSLTEISGSIMPSICWYQHGLTVSGPNSEIRHYKKVGSTWICDSSYTTAQTIHNIIAEKYEKCIGLTASSEIVTFGSTKESMSRVRNRLACLMNICPLNPTGEFMIVMRMNVMLDVYRIATAEILTSLTLANDIKAITEHPKYPFIATAHANGYINLISFYNELKPTILITVSLSNFDLTTIRFFEHGHLLVVGNSTDGHYFILKALPGTQIEVLIHLHLGRQIVDYMLVASQNIFRFFALPVTQNKFYAGNRVIRYCIVDNQVVNIKEFKFENENTLYRALFSKTGHNRDRIFYITPLNSRQLCVAETKRGSPIIAITDHIKTGHQLKKFHIRITERHVISFGYDGFIIVRSRDFQHLEGIAIPHHRHYQGVYKAIINPSATIIVSLGYDGVLTATRLPGKFEDLELQNDLQNLKDSSKVALIFKRPTLGFDVEERFAGKCWTEIQRLKTIEIEEKQCKIEREKILKEFNEIQAILQDLVSENILAPENKKLDLLEFYLDTKTYKLMQQKNKEECKELETYLKCLIQAQDKVSDFIIKNYYIPMGVQWQNIFGIFSAVKATNYCLLPQDPSREQRLRWIEEQRKVEQCLSFQNTFEPWHAMTKEEIMELLSKHPTAPKDDYTGLAGMLKFTEENEVLDMEKYLETKIALLGTVSSLYIDSNPAHYRQRQLCTFYQCELQQAVAEMEVVKLKQNYNKCFLNTRALKEREMYNIQERNARLRHIISEYNYFSTRKINIQIIDPEWARNENVETAILRVSDDEVPVRPYISPSEQVILDAKWAEEERLRRLLLADDFRERALMAMMNGVLEVRWEDELKKDVPKPKCMLEKVPEEFNEDDLRAIRDYEEKDAQLQTEREKYKSLLEVEFGKLSIAMRDTIRKFNQKLYECTKFKFYIDCGMNTENLTVNRQRVIQNSRIELDVKEQKIIEHIKEYEKRVDENQKVITYIQEAVVECKNNLEFMQAKEKLLEKAYKKDFQDMSPVIQEQSYKMYKKRPKASFRIIATATILNELAKGVATNETSFAMTQDCFDYLKALDTLDMFAGLPPTIDENVWNLICKHRRQRIEYEIRLRAAQIQILEGEVTISTFVKRVATQKEKVATMNADLEQTRADRLHLIHNKQVQLVLRRGLVEAPLTGDLFADFVDVILVPKSEINRVNNLILDAGRLKLKTIMQNMKFRRTIMGTEWEHTRLRMRINDLIEQKKDIENVKFTIEMQTYLKNKSLGRKQEMESYEMEIELVVAAFENRIKDKKDKVKKIQHQLKSFRDNNKHLDQVIKEVNIDLCYYKVEKDYDVEAKEKEIEQARLSGMLKRNELVQKVQENHNEILVLQAELELLRLRTFPTFKYRVLDE